MLQRARSGRLRATDWAQVFDDTLPTATGQRNRQLFKLARFIKSFPEFADVETDDLADGEVLVADWHEEGRKRGVIATVDPLESITDFLTAWQNILFLEGESMVVFLEAAQRKPLPECANRYGQHPMRRLVGLCRELHHRASDDNGVFYLSVRTVGDLFGVTPKTGSLWLKELCLHRVLELVEPGQRGGGKAARYRYTGD